MYLYLEYEIKDEEERSREQTNVCVSNIHKAILKRRSVWVVVSRFDLFVKFERVLQYVDAPYVHRDTKLIIKW